MVMRKREVRVRLSEDESALLDELRPTGVTRAAFLRSFLRTAPRPDRIASREQALAMLTAQAEDGKVAATIALVRELRDDEAQEKPNLDELERILRPS